MSNSNVDMPDLGSSENKKQPQKMPMVFKLGILGVLMLLIAALAGIYIFFIKKPGSAPQPYAVNELIQDIPKGDLETLNPLDSPSGNQVQSIGQDQDSPAPGPVAPAEVYPVNQSMQENKNLGVASVESHVPADVNAIAEALSGQISDLTEKVSDLESSIDELKKNNPNSDVSELEGKIEGVNKRISGLERQVSKLAKAENEKVKKTETLRNLPPFRLETFDIWDRRAMAVVVMDGRTRLLAEGDSAAGWMVKTIIYPDYAIFMRDDGLKVEMRPSGRVSRAN